MKGAYPTAPLPPIPILQDTSYSYAIYMPTPSRRTSLPTLASPRQHPSRRVAADES